MLSVYDTVMTGEAVNFVNAPPAVAALYTLYPLRFVEVLALQLRVTLCCIGVGTADAVKLTPVLDAPFIVTEAVLGLNVEPDVLGATMYEPFGNPVKLKLPTLSVVVERDAVPDKVNVADAPLTLPEILYVVVVGGGSVGVVLLDLKTTSTQ